MPLDELPEAKFDRLKKQLQEAILRDYPNPERESCPGDAVLRELAERPIERAVEDHPFWDHITHCSECYREFLDFNRAFRKRREKGPFLPSWVIGATAVLIACAAVAVYFQHAALRPERPKNADLTYVKTIVDIPSMTRSGDSSDAQPIVLRREPEELIVQLPVGSRAGTYQLQLRKKERIVFSATANANIHNGTTALTLKVDLSKFEPGTYSVVVRQVSFDWSYSPVIIR